MKRLSVLFVCLGNLCRSPMAEGSFSALLGAAGLAGAVDAGSAGLHDQFHGQPPDPRAQRAARSRGIDISAHRARQIHSEDFATYDYVLAVDRDTLVRLRARCPSGLEHKLHLLLDFSRQTRERDVADPYYGEQHDFDAALALIEQGTLGLLRHVQNQP